MNKRVIGENKKTGKRYGIYANIRNEWTYETAEYVSGISIDTDGKPYGPIRTLRTDKLTFTVEERA